MPSHSTLNRAARWCLLASPPTPASPQSVRIHASPFTIGRRGDAHLALDCPNVSGKHAELVSRGDELQVRDLESTNGTFLNGKRVVGTAPLREGDYLQLASVVFRLNREIESAGVATALEGSCNQSLALVQFDRLMTQRALVPYFQPIVQLSDIRTIGFEVLARSRLFGLQTPSDMFAAAHSLHQEAELSRMCRGEALRRVAALATPRVLFLNTHPCELDDLSGLRQSLADLRRTHADQSIVLEIHEAAVTNAQAMRELRAGLNDLDMRLAYDDFGAGQARLIELVEAPPDYLKFDRRLIRNIAACSFAKQHVLASLVHLTRDLGIVALAEGVETADEHEACRELGFQWGQGYHYGKPAPLVGIPGAGGQAANLDACRVIAPPGVANKNDRPSTDG
jgi:EAL domain-containing protein (putative c-di-GMP-specific phosphodiesterase class I)